MQSCGNWEDMSGAKEIIYGPNVGRTAETSIPSQKRGFADETSVLRLSCREWISPVSLLTCLSHYYERPAHDRRFYRLTNGVGDHSVNGTGGK
jgi:hypothetical protein